MERYQAIPHLGYRCDCGEPSPWLVAIRSSDGLIRCGAKTVASFSGENAERDAKCHAAKLNERESGVAPAMSPEDGAKLVEEGEAFIAGMAKVDPELEAAMNTDPRSGERYRR